MNFSSISSDEDALFGISQLSVLSEDFDNGDEVDEVVYVNQQGIVTGGFCQNPDTSNVISSDCTERCEERSFHNRTNSNAFGRDRPIEDLSAEEIRWFYKSEAEKQWVPFSGYDSIRIEERFRQMNDLRRSQYEEGAQASFTDSEPLDNSFETSLDAEALHQLSRDHIVVRGGMYEVAVAQRKCVSIFWPGEQYQIMRGTWFYDGSWQPLEEDRGDQIENIHLSLFRDHFVTEYVRDSNKVPKTVLRSENFTEFRVDWYSPLEVYLYSEAAPSKLVRSFTQKLGYFQKSTGYQLCRGYKTMASMDDRPVDVTHLVFVIHGIGQKMDKDRIIRNTCMFRDCTSYIQNKYFPSSQYRAEFFPVEWRSSLRLDGGIVEAITPNKVQGIRQLLNATAMDIMYYTSQLYSGEIQDGLACELNKLYSLFIQRNPGFTSQGGKVSIIAHSLGCVIVYDIVTGWSITDTLEPKECFTCAANGTDSSPNDDKEEPDLSNRPQGTSTPTHRPAKLLFKLDNLFCLGSPLAVFLALRVKDPQASRCHKDLLPPNLCHRFFNIFHPSDPVAYRMEPFLVREYTRIAPLQIQAYNAAVHTFYSEMPLDIVSETGQAPNLNKTTDETDSPKSPNGTPSRERGWSLWGIKGIMKGGWKTQDGTGSSQMDSPTQELEHRLDYALRDSVLPAPYAYISAITSHTDYWGNYDVAYFVLTRLFPELEKLAVATSSNTVNCDSSVQSPQQQSPQHMTPRVSSPPLFQQMLSQVKNQTLPLSPTLVPQRKGSGDAASR